MATERRTPLVVSQQWRVSEDLAENPAALHEHRARPLPVYPSVCVRERNAFEGIKPLFFCLKGLCPPVTRREPI
jgi:hypothetical protein